MSEPVRMIDHSNWIAAEMNEKHLVMIQAISAMLMGSDYFMPEQLRKAINDPLRDYFSGLKERSFKPFPDYWVFFWTNKRKTLYPLMMVAASLIFAITNENYWHLTGDTLRGALSFFVPMIAVAWFALFGISVILVANYIINPFVILVFLSFPITGVAFFLEKSGKGPMAAVGFLILMLTFIIRYLQASR